MSPHKNILKKTIQVGSSTLLSRFFGILREVLMVRYLGVSGLSDAFLTAFKIPNSLRKIFAEGALSAAFIPTIVSSMQHENKDAVSGLMTLSFIGFEGIVVALCIFTMIYAHNVIQFIVPGFSPEQVAATIPMLRILMPFIFFVSSSALLGGALQANGHFFVPAIAPVLVNIIFIAGICIALAFNLPVTYLCWFILFAGLMHLALHLYMYFKSHFFFGNITPKDRTLFIRIMGKFLLCLPTAGLMEFALFIDTSFASFLPAGSISLLYYANRFVGIPLGVFAAAFSTILLPHFSRTHMSNPKRLHFYLLESTKFIFWVTIPVMLLMAFFSREIFSTIFLSKNFTQLQVEQAGAIFLAFLAGLFFLSLNKILLNIFYAMHVAWIPAVVALSATCINILLNMFFIERFQAVGLAMATTLAAMVQTFSFLIILRKQYQFRLYIMPFMIFATRYCIQLLLIGSLFVISYYTCAYAITAYLPVELSIFLMIKMGLWFWVGPLAIIFLILVYYGKKLFNIHLYFLK